MTNITATTPAPYAAPTVTSYTEAELFSLMEAWGFSGPTD